MQTAAIYARVSTDWQAEHGYSLETQIAACEKYAADLGAVSVTKYIDDGYSGAYLDRPRLDALRDALRAKIYDVVIVYTPDRLSRRLSHQLLLTEEIERSGAALHFVNAEYKTTPEGQLFFQMQGAFAEYEREKIRERTMRGKRGKLKRGLPVSDAGVYGYDFKDGAYIINEREAETVRLIFRMYVEREGGTDAIAAKLAEMGIPSPRGLSKWQGGNVCRLLKKRMYTGEYYSNTHFSHKTGAHSRTVTPRPKSEWISMSCPAIIDKSTFEAAQHLLASNKKQAKRKYQRGMYLLQGLAVCAKCGRAIVVANNGEKRYYACISSGHPKTGQERCGARYAKTSVVDAAFWETLSKICATPAKIEAYIKKTDRAKTLSIKSENVQVKKRLAKIDAEKLAVMEWHSSGLISQEAATAKLASLTAEAKRLKESLAAPRVEKVVDISRIHNEIANCTDDAEARRRAVQNVVRRVEFERTDTTRSNYELKFLVYFI